MFSPLTKPCFDATRTYLKWIFHEFMAEGEGVAAVRGSEVDGGYLKAGAGGRRQDRNG